MTTGQGTPLFPLILVVLTTPRDLKTDCIASACQLVWVLQPCLACMLDIKVSGPHPWGPVGHWVGWPAASCLLPTLMPQSPGRPVLSLLHSELLPVACPDSLTKEVQRSVQEGV